MKLKMRLFFLLRLLFLKGFSWEQLVHIITQIEPLYHQTKTLEDSRLSFKAHVDHFTQMSRIKIDFFLYKASLSFDNMKKPVQSTVISVFDMRTFCIHMPSLLLWSLLMLFITVLCILTLRMLFHTHTLLFISETCLLWWGKWTALYLSTV